MVRRPPAPGRQRRHRLAARGGANGTPSDDGATFDGLEPFVDGDYYATARRPDRGTDVDHCIDAMVRGIREAGDGRPFSIQLKAEKSISTQYPYWARRVDWNFVYTYYPIYKGVLDAYRRQPAIPAVLGEASFTPPGPNAAGDNDWLLVLTG